MFFFFFFFFFCSSKNSKPPWDKKEKREKKIIYGDFFLIFSLYHTYGYISYDSSYAPPCVVINRNLAIIAEILEFKAENDSSLTFNN